MRRVRRRPLARHGRDMSSSSHIVLGFPVVPVSASSFCTRYCLLEGHAYSSAALARLSSESELRRTFNRVSAFVQPALVNIATAQPIVIADAPGDQSLVVLRYEITSGASSVCVSPSSVRSSVLVIVAVGWVVPRDGPVAGKTRSCGALVLPEACLETCLEAWSLCFFACGVRWVKFPCFVILDFAVFLRCRSHGWRQSVDTKVDDPLM
ncbi:hypothetical protein Tco_1017000 [Tanacetum coccineum]|uniref:Uncharacterized protein n=1 Tax=Tanacetum coccineum TaxID=301880 RepID=A0ABQ5FRG0_9ASTR